jgi:hypothetical protein
LKKKKEYKPRINLTLSKSVIDDLQLVADKWGVSKSLACGVILSQYFLGQRYQGQLPPNADFTNAMEYFNEKR